DRRTGRRRSCNRAASESHPDRQQLPPGAARRLRRNRRDDPRPPRPSAARRRMDRAPANGSRHWPRYTGEGMTTATPPDNNSGAFKAGRHSFSQTAWANTLGRFLALVVVFMFFAFGVSDGKFYTPMNLESIARQSTVYGIAAIG